MLNNLGELYRTEERFAEAEPLLKRSIAIREKTVGPDDPDIVLALSNLAALYSNQGRYDQAEPLFKRVLAVLEKAHGPSDPNATVLMNNLADVYTNPGFAMPMPSGCSSGRWPRPRKRSVPTILMLRRR